MVCSAMMHATRPVTLSLIWAVAQLAHGQNARMPPTADTGLQRFELGVQTANMRTGCIGSRGCFIPSFGLGIGGAMNLSQHFALDTNFLITPASSNGSTDTYGGRATEFLAGARAESRGRHYGFFLKAQPGFLDWSHVITQVTFTSPTAFEFTYGHRTRFASAVGAGFEYSPAARIHIRAEFTDLILRDSGASWTNNFQPSAAVYYGLGKSLAWQPPVYDAKKSHPFGSPTNLVLIGGSVLASTADAVTTQHFIADGYREGDPFARPLVKYGWSGQIALISLETTGEVFGMYGLHRLGQHWVERMVPVSLAITHGVLAYNNSKANSRPPVE
jgi:hypothetical protein